MSRESRQQTPKARKTSRADERDRRAARGAGSAGRTRGSRTAGSPSPAAAPRRPRPAFTSRAAILVLVVCVIALSLAYPLREYAAQRAEIAQLREEQARMRESVEELSLREQALGREEYIESEARARLHYQYPGETAYIVIRPEDEDGDEDVSGPRDPWFEVLWRSVEEADGR